MVLDSVLDRDRKAYELARQYLLDTGASQGVTKDILDHYLSPPSRLAPIGMADAFYRLLESAQNRNMMASVIGRALGGLKSLGPVLCNFDPSAVVQRYHSWEQLLDAIQNELRPVGKIRRAQGSLWPLFARAVLSGARFLAQFSNASDFIEWVRVFDKDDREASGSAPADRL